MYDCEYDDRISAINSRLRELKDEMKERIRDVDREMIDTTNCLGDEIEGVQKEISSLKKMVDNINRHLGLEKGSE